VIGGDSGHYVVAAFAPMSYYESVVGEAEKTTWHPLRLPLLTATDARLEDETKGNLAWWMSRGRVRALRRSLDLLSERKITVDSPYLAWEQLSNDIGDIGGVPPLDPATMANPTVASELIGSLLPLEPIIDGTLSGTHIKGRLIPKQTFIDALRNGLVEDGLSAVTSQHLAYYADVALDGMSNPNGEVVFPDANHQEIGYLLNLALDLLIEWESEGSDSAEEASGYLAELLSDQNKLVALFFNNIKGQLAGATSDKQAVIPSLRIIHELFPMPVVSPQFGNLSVAEAKNVLLSTPVASLADASVANKPNVTFKFFLNQDKMEKFLSNDEALSAYLRPPSSLVCVPLDGETINPIPPGLATWLEHEDRLTVIPPRQMLGDFLTCVLAWGFSNNIAEGSVPDILSFLKEQAVSGCGDDRSMDRRLSHYTKSTEEFLTAIPSKPNQSPISLAKSGTRVGDLSARSRFFEEAVGLAFVEGQDDLDFMYELRTTASGSAISQLRSGLTAVLTDSFVVKERRPNSHPTHSLVLRNIKEDLGSHQPSLQMLAALVDESVFAQLGPNDELRTVLKGLHKFYSVSAGLADTYVSELKTLQATMRQSIQRIESIEKKRESFETQTGIKVTLTESENVLAVLRKLNTLAGDACSKNLSNFTRHLAAALIATLASGISESLLHPDETDVGLLTQRTGIGERYRSALESIKALNTSTYAWLDVSAPQIVETMEARYGDAVKQLMAHQAEVDIKTCVTLEWDVLDNTVDDIGNEARMLIQTDGHITRAKEIAESINSQLKKVNDD